MMKLYENVKAICDSKKMSIRELEFLASISYGSIGHWRKSAPRIDNVVAVANALDVSVGYLLGETNESN